MSIVDSFRDMPDFKAKERPSLSLDRVSVRHEINALIRDKLADPYPDMLHPGLDRILPGTTAET
jgi:hypothetical protein